PDPWRVALVPLGAGAGSRFHLTLAVSTVGQTSSLLVGMGAEVVPTGANPAARIEMNATIASMPVTGGGSVAVLPEATLVLRAGVDDWSHILAEIACLLGLVGPIAGAGTLLDPWRVALGSSGLFHLEIAAWNAQTGGSAPPQQLRLGLRAAATSNPIDAWWMAELLGFDLHASGASSVAFMAGHHAAF